MSEVLHFGPFRLDGDARTLVREGRPVALTPKSFQVLVLLVRRAGHAVPRRELIDALWPDAIVEEGNLDWNVSALRRALGEAGDGITYIETVRGFGYRFAAPVTRAAPEVEEAGPAAANAEESEGPAPSRAPAPARGRPGHVPVLLAVCVLAALAWGLPRLVHGSHGSADAFPRRTAVAVLGFRNLSGRTEADGLSPLLAGLLTRELAAGEGLRAVPEDEIARVKAELALPAADSLSKESLARLRRILRADFVLVGSFLVAGGTPAPGLRLDLRLEDAATGETVAVVSETGAEADVFRLSSQIAAPLREKLGVGPLSTEQARSVAAAFPSDPSTALRHALGVERLRRGDALGARDLLLQVVAREPDLPTAHAALAEAWDALGDGAKAAEEARRAAGLAGRLAREERLALEARSHAIARDLGKAIPAYRSLFTFLPDGVGYGIALAEAETEAKRLRGAHDTMKALRGLPSPERDDPRLDLVEARLAQAEGEPAAQRDLARRAAGKAAEMGARLLLSRAREMESRAEIVLGELARAEAAAAEGARLAEDAGDPVLALANLLLEGDASRARSGSDDAARLYAKGLELARRVRHAREEQVFRRRLSLPKGH